MNTKHSFVTITFAIYWILVSHSATPTGIAQEKSQENSPPAKQDNSGKQIRVASNELLPRSFDADQVSKLVKNLSDSKFSVRQAASEELLKFDAAILPELANLVVSGNAEQSWRATQILTKLTVQSDQQTMAKIARVFKLLGEHGHPELLAEASLASQNWKQHQVKKTANEIRELGGQVTGFEPGQQRDPFGGAPVFRVYATTRPGQSTGQDRIAAKELQKLRSKQKRLTSQELKEKIDEIIQSDTDEDLDELRKMEIVATPREPQHQVFSGDVVLELAGGELVAAGGPSVVIGENWKGGNEKLHLLLDLPAPNTLVIQNQNLDKKSFDILKRIRVKSLSIHQCEYDSRILREFAKQQKQTYIDVKGKALLGVRGPLSVTTVNGRSNEDCVISEVIPGSAAAKAGIKVDDKIIEVSGREIKTFQDLVFEIAGRKIGAKVKLIVERGGEEIPLELQLGDASIADD